MTIEAVLGAYLAAVTNFSQAASEPAGYAELTVLILIGIAVYVFSTWFWPWGAECGKCEGKGKFRSPTGRYWRPCPKCKGKPKVRWGRRVLDYIRKERH